MNRCTVTVSLEGSPPAIIEGAQQWAAAEDRAHAASERLRQARDDWAHGRVPRWDTDAVRAAETDQEKFALESRRAEGRMVVATARDRRSWIRMQRWFWVQGGLCAHGIRPETCARHQREGVAVIDADGVMHPGPRWSLTAGFPARR